MYRTVMYCTGMSCKASNRGFNNYVMECAVMQLDGCMYGWKDVSMRIMHGCRDEWMNGWMDGWMDKWMDGWLDRWIDAWTGAFADCPLQ